MMTAGEQAWIVQQYVSGARQVDISRELGLGSQTPIGLVIRSFCNRWMGVDPIHKIYDKERTRLAWQALQKFYGSGGRAERPDRPADEEEVRAMNEARIEYAAMLRLEGKTFREIGERLGVCAQQSTQLVRKFGWRLRDGMKRTRWHGVDRDQQQYYQLRFEGFSQKEADWRIANPGKEYIECPKCGSQMEFDPEPRLRCQECGYDE